MVLAGPTSLGMDFMSQLADRARKWLAVSANSPLQFDGINLAEKAANLRTVTSDLKNGHFCWISAKTQCRSFDLSWFIQSGFRLICGF